MLNDARVASACLYVRTCQRVRNSKNIATIRNFHRYIRVNSTNIPFHFYILSPHFESLHCNAISNLDFLKGGVGDLVGWGREEFSSIICYFPYLFIEYVS